MFTASESLWLAETNTYVVASDNGGPCVVIDAPPDLAGIVRLLKKHDLYPEAVLLTHGHIDHMGGSGVLFEEVGAVTYIHPDDDFLTLDPMDQLRSMMGGTLPGRYDAPVERADLFDGAELNFAGLTFEVLHTPGHTPGHCCFLEPKEGVLWSGDQLFAGGIGRTDLRGGSTADLFRSMKTQIMILDGHIEVLPGHGPPTTVARERTSNPFRDGWR